MAYVANARLSAGEVRRALMIVRRSKQIEFMPGKMRPLAFFPEIPHVQRCGNLLIWGIADPGRYADEAAFSHLRSNVRFAIVNWPKTRAQDGVLGNIRTYENSPG